MKKYLVAYWNGTEVISHTVTVEENYIPSMDNCKKLKQIIIDKYRPRWSHYGCGRTGNISSYDDLEIHTDELQLVAVSNLSI